MRVVSYGAVVGYWVRSVNLWQKFRKKKKVLWSAKVEPFKSVIPQTHLQFSREGIWPSAKKEVMERKNWHRWGIVETIQWKCQEKVVLVQKDPKANELLSQFDYLFDLSDTFKWSNDDQCLGKITGGTGTVQFWLVISKSIVFCFFLLFFWWDKCHCLSATQRVFP